VSSDDSQAALFAGIAGGAAAGFALVALASARRKTSKVDRAVERKAHVGRKRRAGRAARGMAPLVKTYTMVPAAAAVAAWMVARPRTGPAVTRRSRAAGAAAILASAIVSGLAEPVFDHLLPQPPVPGGRTHKQPVFPSGHTFKPTALGLACAHVLSREGLVPRGAAYGVAAGVSVVSGLAKLVARKHWLSDLAGGAFAGVAIGCGCCAGYEVFRGNLALRDAVEALGG